MDLPHFFLEQPSNWHSFSFPAFFPLLSLFSVILCFAGRFSVTGFITMVFLLCLMYGSGEIKANGEIDVRG